MGYEIFNSYRYYKLSSSRKVVLIMHDISKGSASPVVYLLTGYIENNKPIPSM